MYAHLFLITSEVAFDKHRGLKEEKRKRERRKAERKKSEQKAADGRLTQRGLYSLNIKKFSLFKA
jgi:hypothetical protein